MKKFLTCILALVLAIGCVGCAFAAEDADVQAIMAEFDLTTEDIEFVTNIFKQINEGNTPKLVYEKAYYYPIELKLAKLGAAMGNGELCKWVGEIYQGGHVEGVSEAEAVEIAFQWWEKAATELNMPGGWTNMGLVYQHSSVPGGGKLYGNVEKDNAKALEMFLRAYEEGDTKAPRYIALLYHNGEGVEQNPVEAARFFQIACDLGDTTAHWYLGDYYYNGTGVEQDYAKAKALYERAAASAKATPPGVKQSRYALGVMYEQGVGVEADLETAISWYKGAAEANYEPALEALERLGVK